MDEITDINLSENQGYSKIGFQATEIGKSIEILKEMIEDQECKIMISFTANLMASGLRGIFKQMIDEDIIDVVFTTGGAIDHDIIKAYKPYLLGDFKLNDEELHKKGVNRLGNILIPTDRYELLEEKILPVLKTLNEKKKIYPPSEFIQETARILDNNDMFIKKCFDKEIPIICPSLIDSAIGLQLYFFKQNHPDFVIDDAGDLKKMHDITLNSKKMGGIIIGGGVSKHHLIGSTLLRGGLDTAIYLTTASEYDGSLSGATPHEAKSWGKINEKGKTATVFADATISLPIIIKNIIQ